MAHQTQEEIDAILRQHAQADPDRAAYRLYILDLRPGDEVAAVSSIPYGPLYGNPEMDQVLLGTVARIDGALLWLDCVDRAFRRDTGESTDTRARYTLRRVTDEYRRWALSQCLIETTWVDLPLMTLQAIWNLVATAGDTAVD
jgi:hypothetical protein